MEIGCVVMAAGDARRFGENKLAMEVGGRTLVRRALEAVPGEAFRTVAVVTQYPEVEALAEGFGFLPVRNPHPDWGISHTIRLGLEALGEVDAAAVLPGAVGAAGGSWRQQRHPAAREGSASLRGPGL